MTETPTSSSEHPEIPQVNGDWLLGWLIVEIAEQLKLEPGVTLMVGGATICGQLISESTYFKELGQGVAHWNVSGGTEDGRKAILNMFAKAFEGGQKLPELRQQAATADEPSMLSYVHLRKARIVTSHGSMNGALWRGHLSAVGGFMLGELED